jgi:hypothetical protein
MRLLKAIVIFTLISPIASAQEQDRVMIRCGASSGHGFFFKDKSTNPDGPSSSEDQIKNGKIILVRYGKNGILFLMTLSALAVIGKMVRTYYRCWKSPTCSP